MTKIAQCLTQLSLKVISWAVWSNVFLHTVILRQFPKNI